MDPDSKRLRVSVSDGTGRAVRDGGLARVARRRRAAAAAGEVSIALVSDARMRALNRKYRRQGQGHRRPAFRRQDDALGDRGIATSRSGVASGARRRPFLPDRAARARLAWLLHLLGYDHEPADNGRMGRVEARSGARADWPAGLIERASACAVGEVPAGGRMIALLSSSRSRRSTSARSRRPSAP